MPKHIKEDPIKGLTDLLRAGQEHLAASQELVDKARGQRAEFSEAVGALADSNRELARAINAAINHLPFQSKAPKEQTVVTSTTAYVVGRLSEDRLAAIHLKQVIDHNRFHPEDPGLTGSQIASFAMQSGLVHEQDLYPPHLRRKWSDQATMIGILERLGLLDRKDISALEQPASSEARRGQRKRTIRYYSPSELALSLEVAAVCDQLEQ